MVDTALVSDVLVRLERLRGDYLGDGINPGVRRSELIKIIGGLHDQLDYANKGLEEWRSIALGSPQRTDSEDWDWQWDWQ